MPTREKDVDRRRHLRRSSRRRASEQTSELPQRLSASLGRCARQGRRHRAATWPRDPPRMRLLRMLRAGSDVEFGPELTVKCRQLPCAKGLSLPALLGATQLLSAHLDCPCPHKLGLRSSRNPQGPCTQDFIGLRAWGFRGFRGLSRAGGWKPPAHAAPGRRQMPRWLLVDGLLPALPCLPPKSP